MAVVERPGKRVDSALDEVIKEHRVYTLKNGQGAVLSESDTDSELSDRFVTREDLDKRSAEINEKLASEKNRDIIREQRRQSRRLTGRRVFETVVVLLLVVFVSALMILMMYPQTQLAEMSRDNSDTKDRIVKLRNDILDAEEAANGISDMDKIRAQALALGMQDPNQNQIVNLPVPDNDSLKTVISYDSYGVSEEALENAVEGLSDYYRNHPDGGV
ncbi:MAG: hypothetical protein K6A80_11325 [Saccharofermentans sp.]|nr:hypothetical protein [Saccharofermentans sp.]